MGGTEVRQDTFGEGGCPVDLTSNNTLEKDSLFEMEQKTGRTIYELFASLYLSHHMVNITPSGGKTFCAVAPMHHEICDAYRRYRRNILIAPAKFAKSTWTSFFQPIVDGILGIAQGDMLLISNTGRLAEHWLGLIMDEIENNQAIIHDFGKLKGGVWRHDRIKLRTGMEIHSLGLNYQIRGTGWWKVNCDDMEDDEMVRSDDQREKFSDWFDGALLGRMHPESYLNIIGTNLHPLCKINKMYQNAEGKYDAWNRMKFAALDDNQESIWPDRWPTKVILQQRQEMGTKAFLAEKMNEPIFGTDQIVRQEWIQYYDELPTLSELFTVSSTDASSGEAKEVGDYCAITAWGKDVETDEYYFLGGRRGRWATLDKVQAAFDFDELFQIDKNLFEGDAWGKELKKDILAEAERVHRYFPYRVIFPDKKKERRLMAVTPLFQQGKVFFPRKGAERVIDELLMFPSGDYDDYVDSTSQALHFLRRQKPRERARRSIDRPFNRAKPNKAGRLV